MQVARQSVDDLGAPALGLRTVQDHAPDVPAKGQQLMVGRQARAYLGGPNPLLDPLQQLGTPSAR